MIPPSSTHWSDLTLLVVDVEGNGHNPHEIIELASVPIRSGAIQDDAKQWLIHPLQSVTKQATELHGITNEMLADKPTFKELASTIQAVLGTSILVGHYVQVDHDLIKTQLPHWHPMLTLDTIRLAKLAAPNLKSYSLASLIAEFGLTDLPAGTQHRAMYDAVATAKLFIILAKQLDRDGQLTLKKLAELGSSASDAYFSNAQEGLF